MRSHCDLIVAETEEADCKQMIVALVERTERSSPVHSIASEVRLRILNEEPALAVARRGVTPNIEQRFSKRNERRSCHLAFTYGAFKLGSLSPISLKNVVQADFSTRKLFTSSLERARH